MTGIPAKKRRNSLDSNFLAQAKEALAEGRIERVCYLLMRAGAHPERIGTSFKKLREEAEADDLARAKEWLKKAREPRYSRSNKNRNPEVYMIRAYLVRAHRKPEAIGTTKAELKRLALYGLELKA